MTHFSKKTNSPLNQNKERFDLREIKSKAYPYKGKISELGGERNRTAYIPTYESLRYDERTGEPKNMMSESSARRIYEKGVEMNKDSLDFVNKGQGVAATQIFGTDLSQELRNAKNMGEYDGILAKINRGHHNEANKKAAKRVGDKGYAIGTDPTNPKKMIYDQLDPSLRTTYDQPRIDKFRERYN